MLKGRGGMRSVEVRGKYRKANERRKTERNKGREERARGRAQREGAVDLGGAVKRPKDNQRASSIDPKKQGGLLRAVEAHEGEPTVRIALKMLPHVFVR